MLFKNLNNKDELDEAISAYNITPPFDFEKKDFFSKYEKELINGIIEFLINENYDSEIKKN